MSNQRRSLLLLSLITSMSAGADGLGGYRMLSYLEHSSGAALVAGRYDAAIKSAHETGNESERTSLAVHTNLCVAYTAQRVFSKARAACDEAVRLARGVDGRRPRTIVAQQPATANALMNRGVMNALRGEISSAAADLRKAAALGARPSAARYNLALLEASVP